MKAQPTTQLHLWSRIVVLALLSVAQGQAAPATLLFEEDFRRGIPGWTYVQPPGNYIDGPGLWQYDIVDGGFVEQSNIYTDSATASTTRTAVMLINDTVAPEAFTYRARLIAGDDDGFGLIFGYQGETTFYRVTFARQNRTGWPFTGWSVDRMEGGAITDLFGGGMPDHVPTFVNTAGIPFDVVIAVANQRLTLTVVEDPEGFAAEYPLVDAGELPTPVGGRVGLFSWGQRGGVPTGFRIRDPELSPTALAGGPDRLEGWTPLITPSEDGNDVLGSGNGGVPLWGLGVHAGGPTGLIENSDAFAGNTDFNRVDFPGIVLVGGEPTWTDYVYSMRVQSHDDDGFGAVFRFQDERNFYRLAMRRQASTIGVKTGLSIQKAVNGEFTEIAEETAFIPPISVPLDLHISISGNRLQVLLIEDPDGHQARAHLFGPYSIDGGTVDSGRIGILSWAQNFVGGGARMAGTEVDRVRVHEVSGEALMVESAVGTATPAPGLHAYAIGTEVTASVTSPTEAQPGVRRTPAGWRGLGSVPASGTGGTVTFTMDRFSRLEWLWQTEYRAAIAQEGTGRVVVNGVEVTGGEAWLVGARTNSIQAEAGPGFVFTGWSGDVASRNANLTITGRRPLALTARFEVDTAGDGLPDAWKLSHFGSLDVDPDGDPDGDGRTNREEYWLGTNPLVAEPRLADSPIRPTPLMNAQRDPSLPGVWVVADFGMGFRGAWENSNQFRGADDAAWWGADNLVPNASFDGPTMVVREELWNPDWRDYTVEAVFSVGDNDGNTVFIRYGDHRHYYRVTVSAEANNAAWRAPFGLSVQKRSGDTFTELLRDESFATDPFDVSYYKRVRIGITASGPDFEVRASGWDTLLDPPEWTEDWVFAFSDAELTSGRAGVGVWGQQGGSSPTDLNPVANGALIESFAVRVGGETVLSEDWNEAALPGELPTGWEPVVTDGVAGNWEMSAHGSIVERSSAFGSTSGGVDTLRGDGAGPVLAGPAPGTGNYLIEMSLHPFDDDGIGFVYDLVDPENYARVLFVSEATAAGRVPQGLNVTRRESGQWRDVVVGDDSFVYVPGEPFEVWFASVGGTYHLVVRPVDRPDETVTWRWTDSAAREGGRFGLASWGSNHAHYSRMTVYGLEPAGGPGGLRIAGVALTEAGIALTIENASGTPYSVQMTESLSSPNWVLVAEGQTGAVWTGPLPAGSAGYWRLVQVP
ncbi:MAG: hypothetical protein KF833_13925 [Verrucomicrobiae bacterium]|nr:hypothetical protein [Verrucomicrobiae bacterium]